jgi:hypothetical protein
MMKAAALEGWGNNRAVPPGEHIQALQQACTILRTEIRRLTGQPEQE